MLGVEMSQEQIEALLREKYAAGELDTGLFDAGLQYVVMDVVDNVVTFTWFESMTSLDSVLGVR